MHTVVCGRVLRIQPGHPEVQKVILEGIATVRAAGKAAGILATDPALAQQYLDEGALFVAEGDRSDTTLLVKAAIGLVQRFGTGLQRGRLGRRAGTERFASKLTKTPTPNLLLKIISDRCVAYWRQETNGRNGALSSRTFR